jgi:SAM-dependent methyltransferase
MTAASRTEHRPAVAPDNEAGATRDGDTLTAEHAYARSLHGAPCRLFVDGREQPWDVDRWLGDPDDFDRRMLAACRGATLDLGCGPGRLTKGLLDRGTPALGVDAVVEAVRLARRRGATAVVRDLFAALPGEGRWDSVLLADGNIGIGGDPHRLMERVSRLLAPGGRLVVEVRRPGTPMRRHQVQLEVDRQRSTSFAWASVPADRLAALAEAAALRLLRMDDDGTRWVATLQRGHT